MNGVIENAKLLYDEKIEKRRLDAEKNLEELKKDAINRLSIIHPGDDWYDIIIIESGSIDFPSKKILVKVEEYYLAPKSSDKGKIYFELNTMCESCKKLSKAYGSFSIWDLTGLGQEITKFERLESDGKCRLCTPPAPKDENSIEYHLRQIVYILHEEGR